MAPPPDFGDPRGRRPQSVIGRSRWRTAPDAISRSPGHIAGVGDPSADREPLRRVRCAYCDEVIGTYERMVLDTHHGARETSLAADPSLYGTEQACFPRYCYRQAHGDGD